MQDNIIAMLKNILIRDLFVEIPSEEIAVDHGLQSVVGLDSVSFVELRVLCERHFRIEIDDDDFSPANFSTLSQLADLIVRKTAAGGVHVS